MTNTDGKHKTRQTVTKTKGNTHTHTHKENKNSPKTFKVPAWISGTLRVPSTQRGWQHGLRRYETVRVFFLASGGSAAVWIKHGGGTAAWITGTWGLQVCRDASSLRHRSTDIRIFF